MLVQPLRLTSVKIFALVIVFVVVNSWKLPNIPNFSADIINNSIKSSLIVGGTIASIFLSNDLMPCRAESFIVSPELQNTIRPIKAERERVYSIEMKMPPFLQPRTRGSGEKSFLNRIGNIDILLIGEHEDNKDILERDDLLESDILDSIAMQSRKKLVVVQTYGKRDEFFSQKDGKVSKLATNSLFTKDGKIRSQDEQSNPIGLSNDIKERIIKAGIDGLSDDEKTGLVQDPEGFVAVTKNVGFNAYVDQYINRYLIPYKIYKNRMSKDVDQANFVSMKMIEDEVLATNIAKTYAAVSKEAATMPNSFLNSIYGAPKPGHEALLVVVLPQEDVAFTYGVPERLRRLMPLIASAAPSTPKSAKQSKDNEYVINSLILNPTAQDTASVTTKMRLSIDLLSDDFRFERPFADFLYFYDSPAVNLITRPKNPISKEGALPEGEYSILGVFQK